MRALLDALSFHDWLILVVALAVLAGLEWGKPDHGVLAPEAAMDTPTPAPQPDVPTGDAVARPDDGSLATPGSGYAPRLYGRGLSIRRFEQPRLTGPQAIALRKSVEPGPWFAAFAVASNGAYGWANDFATADAARTAALAWCAKGGDDCRVVAEVTPKGWTEAAGDTLTYPQGQAYRAVAAMERPRAFARSLNGYWGTGTGAEARAAALSSCRAQHRQSEGIPATPCEVVAEWN